MWGRKPGSVGSITLQAVFSFFLLRREFAKKLVAVEA
ncbi:hypothetical protein FHS83_003797 [Rhizomicrobium palustre]|uniref:Uncharacterized protein n=1 Tax=Rhizomicrobium palustre TaxID=189966 RepID=A0A846N4N0_9PROT|nr:hypothetical protein [Rhizomicrobium palustre]